MIMSMLRALGIMLVVPVTGLATGYEAVAQLRPASRGLVNLHAAGRGALIADITMGQREMRAQSDVFRVDLTRFTVNGGVAPLPWLFTYAGAGWIRAAIEDNNGEGGFSWQAGAAVNLVEHVLSESPVAGLKQAIGMTVDVAYRYSESNRGEDDFYWHEYTVTPLVHVTVTRWDDPLRHRIQPAASALQVGLQYNYCRGSLGDVDVRANRDFAGVLGGQVLLRNDWSATLSCMLFGDHDRVVTLSLGRTF